MADIGRSAKQVLHIQEEIKLHIEFCKDYGLSIEDIENEEEDQGMPFHSRDQVIAEFDIACTAYTRYVLDIGQSEDWLALQVALLPCLIGYGIIARRLYDDPKTARQGKYWKWIETYVAEDYREAVELGSGKMIGYFEAMCCADHVGLIEEAASKQAVSRIDELANIFIHATKVSRPSAFVGEAPLTCAAGSWVLGYG